MEGRRGRRRRSTSPAKRLGASRTRSPTRDGTRSAPPDYGHPISSSESGSSTARSKSPDRPWKGPGLGPGMVRMYLRGRPIAMVAPQEAGQVDLSRESKPPREQLQLEWVYGYRGRDCRANLYQLASGEVVYFIAAIVVIYDPTRHTQRHYLGHNDDIKCISVHPDRVLVASGQVGGHDRSEELPCYERFDPYYKNADESNWYKPHIRIWDSRTLHTLQVIGAGKLRLGVCAVSFSVADGGAKLAVVDESGSGHMLRMWDWKNNTMLGEAKATTEPLHVAAFNPVDSRQLVTAGKFHLAFWHLRKDGVFTKKNGIFDDLKAKFVHCIAFTHTGDVITGDSKGNILLWKKDTNRISHAIIGAHKGGVLALCTLRGGLTLVSGGSDKKVVLWDGALKAPLKVSQIPPGLGGVRSICAWDRGKHAAENVVFVGTLGNGICRGEVGKEFTSILEGHMEELWGLATHPFAPMFVTCDYSKQVVLWNVMKREPMWRKSIKYAAQSADIYPTGRIIAVGTTSGRWCVLDAMTSDVIYERRDGVEQLDTLAYSPNGRLLAVGSHDNFIYIYAVFDDGRDYKKVGRLEGHSSFVTHLDWSSDSRFLQSTSGDYELLYWDVITLRHVGQVSAMTDVIWYTYTCVFGYNVFGMWPEGADGTDVNACAASRDRTLLASSDDFGKVNLFKYPCCTHKSAGHIYPGHSSHVTCVRFLYDDSYLLSTGGADSAIFQWRVVGKNGRPRPSKTVIDATREETTFASPRADRPLRNTHKNRTSKLKDAETQTSRPTTPTVVKRPITDENRKVSSQPKAIPTVVSPPIKDENRNVITELQETEKTASEEQKLIQQLVDDIFASS
ncbi:EML1 [Branchiostoma lanceolatum]|uniref:EML1 protein n=1 Tax=Branchiostoma lanceolatum TaxID=7740 RepID=A0A8J9Z915_BRALA|nr:EML1 [Branchiostoma lanceolatum]